MGSAITVIFFSYFLTGKERFNPLDYFRMGIIEQIRFFFFDVEGSVRMTKKTQPVIKNCAEMIQKIEKQGVWIAKKKRLKST